MTDEKTLKIVIEELDEINDQIVNEIRGLKGDVTGLKGDENIVYVEKKKSERDLGFVGTITNIKRRVIEKHLKLGHITVVAPMGMSVDQQTHNVNADEVASAIASSMCAEKFVLLTRRAATGSDPVWQDVWWIVS